MITYLLLMVVYLPLAEFPQFKPAMREFRGAWVATVDNIDWPSKKNLPSEEQQKELVKIFEVASKSKLNAILLQIRPSCDALYMSKIEPWSEFLTGTQGKPPEPYYDPLAYAIELAHAKGIELHVWFNPYRAKHPTATGPLSSTHIFNARPDLAKPYGRYLWMDPGESETAKWTLRVILDVVKRYDVDGIHIDDYFYPYIEKDATGTAIPFPDSASYQKYRDSGGNLTKKDWRRKNVDDFVRDMYRGVKQEKPWVKVGISPFGIARPNQPEGIKAGIDQFDDPLYADCGKWFREGWCDYMTPQLYWAIDSPGQPYGKLLDWWSKQNVKSRALWPGNYTGRISATNGNWKVEEIENQIRRTRSTKGAGGNVHFSFKSFVQNVKGLSSTLANGLYRERALPPAMPWLSLDSPQAPRLKKVIGGGETSLSWSEDSKARWWAIYRLNGEKWILDDVLPGKAVEIVFNSQDFNSLKAIAITGIGSSGVEGEPAIIATDLFLELGDRIEP